MEERERVKEHLLRRKSKRERRAKEWTGERRLRERQGEPATVIFKGRGWRV